MEKLTYLVSWGKNRETAWSGTNFSLYKALGKYFEVKDINLNGNKGQGDRYLDPYTI